MSISISTPLPQSAAPVRSRVVAGQAPIPVYVYAVSLASLFTVLGVLWDISWHKSIGRDKFLSPPHILIYLGAIFAGLFSGIQVLWNSFFRREASKGHLIRVWGVFYSSLGALFCIWGAIAMLTSAPFDDWWHNAYGLDVKILSPPHTLLAIGMIFLQFGACVSISKYLNTHESDPRTGVSGDGGQYRLLQCLFVICASSLLCMVYTLGTDYVFIGNQRGMLFYLIMAVATLLFLPAFYRVLRLRWGMTAVALGYFLIVAGSNWILQLFPAEPKLGPILTHITHFQPAPFPMLIFIPALVMDWILQGRQVGDVEKPGTGSHDWLKALWISIAFVLLLLVVQYPLCGFLLESPGAHNWFFGGDTWYYAFAANAPYRHRFNPAAVSSMPNLIKGLVIAILAGTLAARISLRWGRWLQNIQR